MQLREPKRQKKLGKHGGSDKVQRNEVSKLEDCGEVAVKVLMARKFSITDARLNEYTDSRSTEIHIQIIMKLQGTKNKKRS